MKHEISAIRAGGSDLPATADFMYDYDGLDYKKFKDVMDITSGIITQAGIKRQLYHGEMDGALQHDLMRSIKKAPFLLMESCPSATNWKPINKPKNRECIWLLPCRQSPMVPTVSCISSSARVRVPPRNSTVR